MAAAFRVWMIIGGVSDEHGAIAVEGSDHADAARLFAQQCTEQAGYLQPMPTLAVHRVDTGELKHCKVAPVVTYEAWELSRAHV